MWTKFSEAQRWRNFSEKCDDVHVFDSSLGVRIVFTPQPDKLVLHILVININVKSMYKQLDWSLLSLPDGAALESTNL